MSTKISILYHSDLKGDTPGIGGYHVYLDWADDMEDLHIRVDGGKCDVCSHYHGEGHISIPVEMWRHMMKSWKDKGEKDFEDRITGRDESRARDKIMSQYHAELVEAGHSEHEIEALIEAKDRDMNPDWWVWIDQMKARREARRAGDIDSD